MPINLLSHQPTILSTLFAAHKASKYKNTWRARGRERASAGCGCTHTTLRFPPRSPHISPSCLYISAQSPTTTAPQLPFLSSPHSPRSHYRSLAKKPAGMAALKGSFPGELSAVSFLDSNRGTFGQHKGWIFASFGASSSPIVAWAYLLAFPAWCPRLCYPVFSGHFDAFLIHSDWLKQIFFGFQEDCNGRERNF